MKTERRIYPRFKIQDLTAQITFENSDSARHVANGEVLDISYTGIKLKLDTPMFPKANSKIKIALTLPDTGIPLTISGMIKHQSSAAEVGLQYLDHPDKNDFDDLVCEFIKR